MTDEVSRNIVEEIKKRSQSYTPEWNFDTEHMDIGSALALVYAQMAAGSAKRFERIPMKNRVAFLNELDACMKPAIPSRGYVSFQLAGEDSEPAEVPRGTELFADGGATQDEPIRFETADDIFVTPAEVTDIYQTFDGRDRIYRMYERSEQEQEWELFRLFSDEGDNLQGHEMYFSQNEILYVRTGAFFRFEFYSRGNVKAEEELLEALADKSCAVFSYYSTDGFRDFSDVKLKDHGLEFYKDESEPAFERLELEGREGYWIRCRLKNYSAVKKLQIQNIKMSSRYERMLPDTVYGEQGECGVNQFFPFGERLDLYREVYFGQEEVLSKKGAEITLSFNVNFVRIPLETNSDSSQNWEWIMKRRDFRPDKEFDVTIEGIVWEYYNGSGWTRIFPDDTGSRSFSFETGRDGEYRSLKFVCPEDMRPVLVNAVETYYIRARIMKINNLYKMTGHYIIPVLENTSFQYRYSENPRLAEMYVFRNSLETVAVGREEMAKRGACQPFTQTGLDGMAVYIGFETAPVGSPLKMLLSIANEVDRSSKPVFWEYWNGKVWKEINLVDETDNLSRSGLVTFMGNADMTRVKMFGKERYWLRLRDVEGLYENDDMAQNMRPLLGGIYMNTTRAENIYRRHQEFFQMETYQENKRFALPDRDIYEARVFVDEQGHLSDEEMRLLAENNKIIRENDESGIPVRAWVEWEPVEDFTGSSGTDRHFVIHHAEGELLFGNGYHGRVPCTSNRENVWIRYRCGGGAHTNIPAGQISGMGTNIGYISRVDNPAAMTGGCDRESLQQAIERTSASLRHQNRAVSARDFEELAMSVARELKTAKCFSGYDGLGRPRSGAVTLVVLPEQYRQDSLRFAELREKLLSELNRSMSAVLRDSGRFFVTLPKLVELRLHIELTVDDFNKVFRVKQEILDRLERFLAPAGRDYAEGWQIGSFPNTMQLQNVISDIPGIVSIGNIMIHAYIAEGERSKDVDVETVKNHRYVLPVNGSHEIVIGVV